MKVSEVIDRFLKWCEPRRAPATLRHYRSRLKRFADVFGDREFSRLEPLELQEFLDVVNAGMAPDTQRANIIVLERLQKWCVEFELLDAPILVGIEKPRGRRRERIPTADEIAAISAAASREFRLIFTALRLCGARPNELCRATVSDIDRKTRCIVLAEHKTAAKTGQPRKIPIGGKLQAVIDESLGERTEGFLFLTARGKPWTPNSLGATFRRLRTQLGLPKDLVIYLARHEFVTRVIRKSGIYVASQAAGHRDIKTTQRYAHLDLDEIRSAQEAAFEDDPPATEDPAKAA